MVLSFPFLMTMSLMLSVWLDASCCLIILFADVRGPLAMRCTAVTVLALYMARMLATPRPPSDWGI